MKTQRRKSKLILIRRILLEKEKYVNLSPKEMFLESDNTHEVELITP